MAEAPASSTRLAIGVVGDDPLAVAGLEKRLSEVAGLRAVAVSPHEAGHRAGREPVDALILDTGPDGRALAHLDALSRRGVPVLALVAGRAEGDQAVAAGARAILERDTAGQVLAAAAAAVQRGLLVFAPTLARRVSPRTAPPQAAPEPLTHREREVLQLLGRGLSNRALAAQLGISEHTAKFHVTAILGKLGARGRTEAVMRAAQLGLIAL